jgi:uncharacterized phage-associated protein
MNEIQKNNDYLLKKAEYSVIDIAKHLLSLDSKREYFTLNKGNFRLNKILHMCQIFHCFKYKMPLFKEPMRSFKDGAVVDEVSSSFQELYHNNLTISTKELDLEKKWFIRKNFEYFKKSKDAILSEFSKDDPAWYLGTRNNKEGRLMPLNEEIIKYYSDFFDDTFREIFPSIEEEIEELLEKKKCYFCKKKVEKAELAGFEHMQYTITVLNEPICKKC